MRKIFFNIFLLGLFTGLFAQQIKFAPPAEKELNGILKLENKFKLEQKEGCIFNNSIQDFIKTGNIFLLNESDSPLKVFNSEGKFLFNVSKETNGEKGYSNSYRSVFPIENTGFIIVNLDGRILFFDNNVGYQKAKRFEQYAVWGKKLVFANGNFFLQLPMSENGKHVIRMDDSFKILDEFIDINQSYKEYFAYNLLSGGIYVNKDSILYEINQFHNQYLNAVDLKTGTITKIDLNFGKYFKPFPEETSRPEIDSYHGTRFDRVTFMQDKYLIIDFRLGTLNKDLEYQAGTSDFYTAIFDLKNNTSFIIRDFGLSISEKFCDDKYLYVLKVPVKGKPEMDDYYIETYSILNGSLTPAN